MEALAIVVATLLGPILAVQAQKWVEGRREQQQRRRWIFRTLMATRATKLAEKHVQALNAVPIEFYGGSRRLRAVVEAWKVYLDHLNQGGTEPSQAWIDKAADLFLEMLGKMSSCLRYKFDPVELRREVYYPRGHADAATDEETIRTGFASLLRGEKALPMEVRGLPEMDEETLAAQKQIRDRLLAWLSGEASPRVRLDVVDAPRRAISGS